MKEVAAKPALLRQMNLSLICRTLLELGSATRAEIAARTSISVTTVRVLLDELARNGTVTALEPGKSSGGRRAMRYALRPYPFLSLYLDERHLAWRVAGLAGEIFAEDDTEIPPDDAGLLQFIRDIQSQWNIQAVGVGVPGIVEAGRYYNGGVWDDVGDRLERSLGLPVILENDLNCIALGCARRHAGESGDSESVNLAYIAFNRSCCGAGIVADGKVIRGARQFAGEVGYLPIGPDGTLDEILQCGSLAEMADAAARAVACLCCITDPALVALGGDRVISGEIDIERVKAGIDGYLPEGHRPLLISGGDYRGDYLSGLSGLTAGTLVPMLPLENKAKREGAQNA